LSVSFVDNQDKCVLFTMFEQN